MRAGATAHSEGTKGRPDRHAPRSEELYSCGSAVSSGLFTPKLRPFDIPFLQEMCYLATFRWSGRTDGHEKIATFEEAKAGEAMEAYLGGWGRKGDYGVIAVSNATGRSIGAAWYRRYVQRYPYELTVAVQQEHQGQGVGGSLFAIYLIMPVNIIVPRYASKSEKTIMFQRAIRKAGFEPVFDEKTYEIMVASTNCSTKARSNY